VTAPGSSVSAADSLARPFLKWAGGKARLAPRILERVPAGIRRYHEPFLGGGAVFFALRRSGLGTGASLADLNPALMETYATVRDGVEPLIEALRPLATRYQAQEAEGRAAFYYEVRACVPATAVERAARLIFLNRTCYNGLYRENLRGEFNVPHGRYAAPRILDEHGLRAAAAALAGVDLAALDFEAACAAARPGDLVYLDPPYRPLSRTARFTSYTRQQFGPAEQERLRDTFEDLTRRGVAALLSNSDHPDIHALYDGRGYRLGRVPMGRSINSKAAGRAPIAELLIDNFDRAAGHS
jgi:DNA adenine methylase